MVILEEKEIHLVKKVSKELGLTYQELGKKIGYSESTLRGAVSKNQVSMQLEKAIELYLEIIKLKEKEKNIENIKDVIATYSKNLIKDIDSLATK